MTAQGRLEPRKKPVQRRSRQTVEVLLTAAAQVFESFGFAAGTTNRIAERAGVSVGTLYQYFPSKEALAVALLEQHVHETSRQLHEWVAQEASRSRSLHAGLRDYARAVMAVHQDRPRLQHLLLEETPLPEGVHRVVLAAEQEAIEAMAGLLELYPTVGREDLERAAYFVIHTVETLTHRYAAHPEQVVMGKDDFVAELVTMLEAYLTRESAGREGS